MLRYQFEENKQHGDARFPVCVYHVDYPAGQQQVLPCHWHDEYEIIFITRGSAVFRIGDSSYEAEEGQVLFIHSGELHSAYCSRPEGCCYHAVVLKLPFLSSSYQDACQSGYIGPLLLKQCRLPAFLPVTSVWEQSVADLLRRIIEIYDQKTPGYELHIKGSLYLLLSLFAENGAFVQVMDAAAPHKALRAEKIKKVLEYISLNCSRRIYIDEMAALINMSRYNFCRFFKEHTGTSPIEYINHIRINKAAELIQSGSFNVTEAALQCGFENMSYFARVFRKHRNTVPSGQAGKISSKTM